MPAGWSPLHTAIETYKIAEDITPIEQLLKQKIKESSYIRVHDYGNFNSRLAWFPLDMAVQQQKKAVVKTLLEHGFTQNTRALLTAIENKNAQIAQYLLKARLDPNAAGKPGNPPLVTAVQLNQTQIVELLLQAGANVNAISDTDIRMSSGLQTDGAPAISYAIRNNNLILLKRLLEAGANTTAFYPEAYNGSANALIEASCTKKRKALNLMLDAYLKIPLNLAPEGNSYLMWLVRLHKPTGCHTSALGPEINLNRRFQKILKRTPHSYWKHKNKKGETAKDWAIRAGNTQMAQSLNIL